MYMGCLQPFGVLGHFGVIQCTWIIIGQQFENRLLAERTLTENWGSGTLLYRGSFDIVVINIILGLFGVFVVFTSCNGHTYTVGVKQIIIKVYGGPIVSLVMLWNVSFQYFNHCSWGCRYCTLWWMINLDSQELNNTISNFRLSTLPCQKPQQSPWFPRRVSGTRNN